ncbi:biliverdin reductase A-like isoform X2 [Babylonia areolata]|uniref:biliverdin reductase A-like isoform X2 n=1 Tax=Babylonia areolata TaxID=304850 RepID=UPI003FD494E4
MAATRSAFGVVVIGIGIAGRVRIRDLQECSCGLELKGFVSRREIEVPGVPRLSMADALTASDISAVIICTENDMHEDYIRQSLESGKHVLVEYPVALSSTVTRDLYTLAANKGLVLHEENIAFLTESHQALKSMAATRQLKTATNSLIGNFNGWVEKLPQNGKPFLSTIAGLQTLYDVFGDMKATKASLDITDTVIKFSGEFMLKSDSGKVTVEGERHREKVQRTSRTYVEFEDGEVFDSSAVKSAAPPGPKKPGTGLFMRDLEIFAAKLRGEKPVDADVSRSVRCIEIAEEAHALLH